jgi:hypothetical protein
MEAQNHPPSRAQKGDDLLFHVEYIEGVQCTVGLSLWIVRRLFAFLEGHRSIAKNEEYDRLSGVEIGRRIETVATLIILVAPDVVNSKKVGDV